MILLFFISGLFAAVESVSASELVPNSYDITTLTSIAKPFEPFEINVRIITIGIVFTFLSLLLIFLLLRSLLKKFEKNDQVFLHKIQRSKMKELWDNEEDEEWEQYA